MKKVRDDTHIYSLPKTSHRFKAISSKVSIKFSTGLEKNSKICNYKKLTIVKAIWSKNCIVGSFILTDVKIYYKTMVIKTAWYFHKNTKVNR